MFNKRDSKIMTVPAPKDNIVHFYKYHNGFNTSNFVFYDSHTNFKKAMNTKLDVEMRFDAGEIEKLLKAFLRLPDAEAFEKLVHLDRQVKGDVDYHGNPKSANLTVMKQEIPFSDFLDDDKEKYTFFDVGVFICLDKTSGIPVFDTNQKASIEVKFAKIGNENDRMVVNIHLIQDNNKNVLNGVATLDNLVSSLKNATQKAAMTNCKKVNIETYRAYGYTVTKNSSEYHAVVCAKNGGNRNTIFKTPKIPDITSITEFPSLS